MSLPIEKAASRYLDNVEYVEDAFDRYGGAVLSYNEVSQRIGDKLLRPFNLDLIKAEARMVSEALRIAGVCLVLTPTIIIDRRRIEDYDGSPDPPCDIAESIIAKNAK